MQHLLAQNPRPQGTGTINGLGTFGNPGSDALSIFETVVSSIIGILTIVAGLWFIFLLITGGLAYMSSGGDKGALEEARKKMITGLIGLIIVVAAMFIADLLGYIIGFDLFNIADTFLKIVPK